MTEFADNNTVSVNTDMTSFFVNKDFHSWMSFELNDTQYKTVWEHIETVKAKDITEIMNNILKLMKKNAEKSQKIIKHHTDKH